MKAKFIGKNEIARGVYEFAFQVEKFFRFQHGQYISLDLSMSSGVGTHDFSIVDVADGNIIKIATRIRLASNYKKALQELTSESLVNISEAHGDFILPETSHRDLVFFAGGIGITPFVSMLNHVISNKLPYLIQVIYSNPDRGSASYLNDLENMSKDNPNIKILFTTERINLELIKKSVPNLHTQKFYMAGGPAMTAMVADFLTSLGVAGDRIMTDDFAGY